MEEIKIGTKETLYEIEDISQPAPNLLQIMFAGQIPAEYGDITLYTVGGYEAATFYEYETVYRQEGHKVWLSNDGSVYQESEPLPEPEPYEPTMDELKAEKKREVATSCERCIYAGVSVTLSDGTTEHYSLTEHDQLNLFGKQSQLASGITQVEYHADGQPCRYYSVVDMQSIIQAAMWHVSYHTTYCNAINMWIAGCQAEGELQTIFYGADIPDEYQTDVLKAYLARIESMAGAPDVT